MGWWLPTFRAGMEAFASQRVLTRSLGAEAAALIEEAGEHIRALGLERIGVLRVNPEKTRCIILCRHPELGRCVLKSVSVQAPAGRISAHIESMKLVARSSAELFPKVYHLGQTFSLEEYVDGKTLHELPRDEWASVELTDFFKQLRALRIDGAAPTAVGKTECTLIVFRFVRTVVKASSYAVRGVRPWPIMSLVRCGRTRDLLDLLVREAASVQLPRSHVIGDLAPANVMRCAMSGRLYVIDVEHLQEGFFCFDCLWLLAMLTRTDCPVEVLEEAYRAVCTDWFCRTTGAEVLMRTMFAVLLEILGAYVGWHSGRDKIRKLRRIVLEDLRREGTLPGWRVLTF